MYNRYGDRVLVANSVDVIDPCTLVKNVLCNPTVLTRGSLFLRPYLKESVLIGSFTIYVYNSSIAPEISQFQ